MQTERSKSWVESPILLPAKITVKPRAHLCSSTCWTCLGTSAMLQYTPDGNQIIKKHGGVFRKFHSCKCRLNQILISSCTKNNNKKARIFSNNCHNLRGVSMQWYICFWQHCVINCLPYDIPIKILFSVYIYIFCLYLRWKLHIPCALWTTILILVAILSTFWLLSSQASFWRTR